MLRGLAHLALWADDVAAAKEWYTGVLGVPPYFERTGPDGALAYIEFRIGDHPDELAVISTAFRPGGPAPAGGGAVASWHVDDARAEHARLLAAGATVFEPPIDREAGFVSSSVVDPFGNILGVMENPHYVERLAELRGAAEAP